MMHTESMIDLFGTNARIVGKQTEGLTHADSLLQPPFRGNCLNWVLGHIVGNRNGILKALGESPIWSEEEEAPYGFGSEPITCDGNCHSLEKLLSDFNRSQKPLVAALERISEEEMARTIETFRGERTVSDHVAFLLWHESYHVGQLELLRQLAGTDDAIL